MSGISYRVLLLKNKPFIHVFTLKKTRTALVPTTHEALCCSLAAINQSGSAAAADLVMFALSARPDEF